MGGMSMKLLGQITVRPLLLGSGYVAMTENDHGIVVEFGPTRVAAIEALVAAVRRAQTPPERFTEPYGPRTVAEWQAEQGEWLK